MLGYSGIEALETYEFGELGLCRFYVVGKLLRCHFRVTMLCVGSLVVGTVLPCGPNCSDILGHCWFGTVR